MPRMRVAGWSRFGVAIVAGALAAAFDVSAPVAEVEDVGAVHFETATAHLPGVSQECPAECPLCPPAGAACDAC